VTRDAYRIQVQKPWKAAVWETDDIFIIILYKINCAGVKRPEMAEGRNLVPSDETVGSQANRETGLLAPHTTGCEIWATKASPSLGSMRSMHTGE
jgi:hypothetical protein